MCYRYRMSGDTGTISLSPTSFSLLSSHDPPRLTEPKTYSTFRDLPTTLPLPVPDCPKSPRETDATSLVSHGPVYTSVPSVRPPTTSPGPHSTTPPRPCPHSPHSTSVYQPITKMNFHLVALTRHPTTIPNLQTGGVLSATLK